MIAKNVWDKNIIPLLFDPQRCLGTPFIVDIFTAVTQYHILIIKFKSEQICARERDRNELNIQIALNLICEHNLENGNPTQQNWIVFGDLSFKIGLK